MPRRNSNRLLKWLILGAAGLFVASIGSLWWGGNSFSDSGVVLTLEASDRATSGDEISYTVRIKNETKVDLSEMSFRLFYAEDTLVLDEDGKPVARESEGFTIDRLSAGQEDSREFKAFLVGDKGAIKTARVHLIFKAGTLRSAFEKEAQVTTAITDLPVTLTLVAPPTAVSGQVVQYILDARNDTDEDLSDLRVQVTYPDGFVVQRMDPTPDQGNTVWDIESLAKGEGTRIRVEGALPGNERETKTVTAVLQRKLNGQYVDYVRTEAFTMISSPLLAVQVVPYEGRDYVSFAGDKLRYTVTFTNNSRYTFLGLMLGVKLEGEMYDLASLRADKGFFDDATKTVVFDPSGIPDLAQLPPGKTGRATFEVPLKAGFAGAAGTSSFFVKATARLSTTNVPSGLDGDEVVAVDSLITKIGTQPTLAGAVLYDDGAGSGLLPPQVGQETVLTVRWQLTNPGNDVRGARVVATLPPGVSWKDEAAAVRGGTAPTYDRNTGKVTWDAGTLSFGTGTGLPRSEATFKISIRPSSNQAGQSVPLVKDASLTGTDAFTNLPVQARGKDLSTDNIEGHAGEGRVTE